MMKRTILTFGLAALLAGTMAIAQGPGGPGGKGGRDMAMRGTRGGGPGAPGAGNLLSPLLAKALDLTDAQREAIRAELQSSRETAKPIAEQLRALRSQVEDAVKSGSDAAIDQLAAQMGTLEGNLQAISLKSRAKIYNTILTAEQRTKLEEMRAEMQQRIQNRRGNRRPPQEAPAPPAGL